MSPRQAGGRELPERPDADLENKKRIDADKAEAFEEFATAINAELRRLNLPVPAGAPAG